MMLLMFLLFLPNLVLPFASTYHKLQQSLKQSNMAKRCPPLACDIYIESEDPTLKKEVNKLKRLKRVLINARANKLQLDVDYQ